jgi:hypothetical protein
VEISEVAGVIRGLVELFGIGFLRHQLEVDEVIENVFLALCADEFLRQTRPNVGHRVVEIVLGNRNAIHLGEHFGIGISWRNPGAEYDGRGKRKPPAGLGNGFRHQGSLGRFSAPDSRGKTRRPIEGIRRICERATRAFWLRRDRPRA